MLTCMQLHTSPCKARTHVNVSAHSRQHDASDLHLTVSSQLLKWLWLHAARVRCLPSLLLIGFFLCSLESLLVFQTMICDLTGMAISNASLLDEATAAAEAMTMCSAIARGKKPKFLISVRLMGLVDLMVQAGFDGAQAGSTPRARGAEQQPRTDGLQPR